MERDLDHPAPEPRPPPEGPEAPRPGTGRLLLALKEFWPAIALAVTGLVTLLWVGVLGWWIALGILALVG